MKKPSEEREEIQLLETVESNMEGYSKTEIDRAKQAKQIYHKVGAPGVENFKYLVKANMIKNCPVVPKDIDNMIGIWGKDITYLKGKMVRRSPRKIIDDTFQIPKALYEKGRKIELHMDVFFINDIFI